MFKNRSLINQVIPWLAKKYNALNGCKRVLMLVIFLNKLTCCASHIYVSYGVACLYLIMSFQSFTNFCWGCNGSWKFTRQATLSTWVWCLVVPNNFYQIFLHLLLLASSVNFFHQIPYKNDSMQKLKAPWSIPLWSSSFCVTPNPSNPTVKIKNKNFLSLNSLTSFSLYLFHFGHIELLGKLNRLIATMKKNQVLFFMMFTLLFLCHKE